PTSMRVVPHDFSQGSASSAAARLLRPWASGMMTATAPGERLQLPYRILVLEDDPNSLSGILEMLGDAGHEVTGAATYEAAKAQLALAAYDLFLPDVRLRG